MQARRVHAQGGGVGWQGAQGRGGVTTKEIKALATAAGVTGAGKQLPFLVILPIKSKIAFIEVQLLLRARSRQTQKDLATVGTPHFAQFVLRLSSDCVQSRKPTVRCPFLCGGPTFPTPAHLGRRTRSQPLLAIQSSGESGDCTRHATLARCDFELNISPDYALGVMRAVRGRVEFEAERFPPDDLADRPD